MVVSILYLITKMLIQLLCVSWLCTCAALERVYDKIIISFMAGNLKGLAGYRWWTVYSRIDCKTGTGQACYAVEYKQIFRQVSTQRWRHQDNLEIRWIFQLKRMWPNWRHVVKLQKTLIRRKMNEESSYPSCSRRAQFQQVSFYTKRKEETKGPSSTSNTLTKGPSISSFIRSTDDDTHGYAIMREKTFHMKNRCNLVKLKSYNQIARRKVEIKQRPIEQSQSNIPAAKNCLCSKSMTKSGSLIWTMPFVHLNHANTEVDLGGSKEQ